MAVFPYLGYWGNTYEDKLPDGKVFRRRYADNTKREYRFPGSSITGILVCNFDDVLQADYAAIRAFVRARLLDGANFFVYNSLETYVLDLTGANATGRHTCDEIIGDTTGAWTQTSNCRFSGTISFYLID